MGKRIKSEKKGGGGEESKFIEEYTPLSLCLQGMMRSKVSYTDYAEKFQ